jgi:hypothetical protein
MATATSVGVKITVPTTMMDTLIASLVPKKPLTKEQREDLDRRWTAWLGSFAPDWSEEISTHSPSEG